MKEEKKRITDDMINNILYKLTIISHIKQGDKLYFNDNNIFIDESYIQSVSRYLYNQNRTICTENINDIIDDVVYITDFIYRNELSIQKNLKEKDERQQKTFFRESNEKILKNFLIKMTGATEGLTNLKLTYNNDINIKTFIDLQNKRLQCRIDKIDAILIIKV